MSSPRFAACATLLLALAAGPVLAQTVPDAAAPAAPAAPASQTSPAPQAAPAAPAPEQPMSPEEAALEAAGEAFGQKMQAMAEEMGAALEAKGGDAVQAKAELDAIQARYQPDADAFADQVTAFIRAQAAQVPDAAGRAEAEGAAEVVRPQIAAIPARVRAEIENPSEDAGEEEAPAPQ